MGAVVLEGPRRAAWHTVATPGFGEDEVLVRVEGSGVCGSNLPAWEGRPWFQYPLPPGSPGHEGWGVVAAVGRKVVGLRAGERVAFLSDRAFAEYAVTAGTSVCRVPAVIDDAPFPGEALACVMNVARRARFEAGQTVAVVGAGFIGAGVVSLAARAGARVIAVSRRKWALELAQGLGAEVVVPLSDDDQATVRAVLARSGGDGCAQVVEAVGLQRTLTLASDLVATGGRLVIAGYHQDGMRQIDLQRWNWRGIDVINAHERSRSTIVAGLDAAADAVSTGALDLTRLVSHRFRFDNASAAFEAMEARPDGFVKAVLTP
jgi:2-desacetyl-2-hydroxyethyl bacteriochlorophyllide A dehydrogenase